MRFSWMVAVVALAACGGGEGTMGPMGGMAATDALGTFGDDTGTLLAGGAGGVDSTGGTGGVNAGGAAGTAAGGAGGTIESAGGTVGSGGAGGTAVTVDPLDPFPSTCEGYTEYRIPIGTCLFIKGWVQTDSPNNDGTCPPPICAGAGPCPEPKSCIVFSNDTSVCPTNHPLIKCEGSTTFRAVRTAEVGIDFTVERFDLDASAKCPKKCP